jgi:aspartyl/asparaginyl-tRNA synthetase
MKPTRIDPTKYHTVVKKLREFFENKGFIEVPSQSRFSILAACEDPTTISQYDHGGQTWPLPQTGQMWLEVELLRDRNLPGCFCQSTSYRNEPNPVVGRHDLIFPMFEFETHGGKDELLKLERELLEHLGFGKAESFPEGKYTDVAKQYGTEELEHEHEARLNIDYGPVFLLKDFPNMTSPFWNMRQSKTGDYAEKVDVILHGVETIGSAERSCDREEMRKKFETISDGQYARTLYSRFSKERVDNEMNEFLKFEFFPRSGGGIGVTRMIKAMELSGLI